MRKLSGLALALLLAAVPSRAQHFELAGMAGFTTKASLEIGQGDIQSIQVKDGFSWGLSAGYYFNPHYGFEATWSQQSTSINDDITGLDLVDVNVNQIIGDFVFQFGLEDAKLRPFILAGAGATIFNFEDPFDSKTKFAWDVGGGVKYFANDKFGIRLQAAYKPTLVDQEPGGYWCDPFFCYSVTDSDFLDQVEFQGGLVFKFGGS